MMHPNEMVRELRIYMDMNFIYDIVKLCSNPMMLAPTWCPRLFSWHRHVGPTPPLVSSSSSESGANRETENHMGFLGRWGSLNSNGNDH